MRLFPAVFIGILIISFAGCVAAEDSQSGSSGISAGAGAQTSGGSFLDQLDFISFLTGNDANSQGSLPSFGEPRTGDREDATPDEEFETRVREIFINGSKEFRGAGTAMDSYQITIHDLITDKEIANPAYLERERGIKVTIVLKDSLDNLQDSLWGHETDATLLAKAFFTSEINEEIGFVAVTYKMQNSDEARASFKLDAADAGQFEGLWVNDAYIRKSDWSESSIDLSSGIAHYEKPGRMIVLPDSEAVEPSGGEDVPMYGKDTLAQQMSDSTGTLIMITENIAEQSRENDYQEMSYLADALIDEARKSEENIASLPVSPELYEVKEQFINGLIEFQHAGSSYWYGATFIQSDEFEQGNHYVNVGLEEINDALTRMNLKTIETNAVNQPSDSPYPDAFALNERYMYQDAGKVNDISVKISKYEIRSGYYIEEEEGKQRVTPGFGYKFLTVVVWVTHLGFRGGGSELVLTPDPEDFTLIYGGEEYTDVTPTTFMQSVGEPYASVLLNRKEHVEGVLIFAVPESIKVAETYIRFDPGNGETPVWQLVSMSSSSVIGTTTGEEISSDGWEVRTSTTQEEDANAEDTALLLNEEFPYQVPGNGGNTALSVKSYTMKESYILKENDEIYRIDAGDGNMFVFAVLGFSNPDAENEEEPWQIGVSPEDISLTCKGMVYAGRTPEGFIEGNAATEGWDPAAQGTQANRHLAFRVPDSMNIDDAYISADIENYGTAVWDLG
jgi:hypothetical protein